jgi:hypothetical protein
MVEVPNDEEWVSCKEFKETSTLPNCLCYVSEDEGFKINCDHVVFPQDFPSLPFRQPITYFSQRFVNYQNIPPQVLAPIIMSIYVRRLFVCMNTQFQFLMKM